MTNTQIILLASIAALCLPTFECFAPRGKKNQNPQTQEQIPTPATTQEPTQPALAAAAASATPQAPTVATAAASITKPVPTSLKETEAFKYLQSHIPDTPATWNLFAWSKASAALNLLRQKQSKTPTTERGESRLLHEIDWGILEAMTPGLHSNIAEMVMRCADQKIEIYSTTLQRVLGYTREELINELIKLKETEDQAFARIRELKALQKLVMRMQSLTTQDDDSDIEDYSEQHIFDKTRAIVMPTQAAVPTPIYEVTSAQEQISTAAPAPTPTTTTPDTSTPV